MWAVMTGRPADSNRIIPDNAVPGEPPKAVDLFQPEKGDVLVFFHVQKSGGGTFNGHLTKLDTPSHCNCNTDPPVEGTCRCRDRQGYAWLFSRFTTSSSCGVHPPIQELFDCVPKFLSAAEGHDDNTKKR